MRPDLSPPPVATMSVSPAAGAIVPASYIGAVSSRAVAQ